MFQTTKQIINHDEPSLSHDNPIFGGITYDFPCNTHELLG